VCPTAQVLQTILVPVILSPTSLGADKAETAVAVAAAREAADAPAHRTDDISRIPPAPAASRAERPRGRAHWIGFSRACVTAVPVPTMFPHIPAHVVQA